MKNLSLITNAPILAWYLHDKICKNQYATPDDILDWIMEFNQTENEDIEEMLELQYPEFAEEYYGV